MSFAQALVRSLKCEPYDEPSIEKIAARRQGVSLGADRLFGTELASKYPARGTDNKVALIAQIESSLPSRAAVARAIYYILLDYPTELTNNESVAAYYASEIRLSTAQASLVEGLWHLDHGNLELALGYLCEPWEAEVDNPKSFYGFAISVLREDPRLLVAFVQAKQTVLESEKELNVYVDALATQGLSFQILQLSRDQKNSDILRKLGQFAAKTTNRTVALAVAQLPCDQDEWQAIQSELDVAIDQDPNGLAGELTMVRALHIGDLPTISRMKRLTERYTLIAQGTAEL